MVGILVAVSLRTIPDLTAEKPFCFLFYNMSSIFEELNDITNRYFDEKEFIEYIFIGFGSILSISKKKQLIKKFKSPRKIPLGKRKFKTGIFKVTNVEAIPTWEFQVITKTLA